MFTIPNAGDSEDTSQSQPDARDFEILVAGLSGTGIVSGCAVTAQGSPNMTLAVASGVVAVGMVVASVSGGNVTITTANATNPRFDLVVVDSSGTKSVIAGTPSANPVFPSPAGKAVLAAVRVPASATSINSQKIVDKRVVAVVPNVDAPGVIKGFASTVAPSGYLLCDGSAVSRTTYAALFGVIGTTFGAGNGTTTFNVPDGQGRMLVGLGTHTEVNAIGKNEGLSVSSRTPKHTTTNALTLPDHEHDAGTLVAPGVIVEGGTGVQGNSGNASEDQVNLSITGDTGNPTTHPALGGTIGVSGTRPTDVVPFFVGNYIIKT